MEHLSLPTLLLLLSTALEARGNVVNNLQPLQPWEPITVETDAGNVTGRLGGGVIMDGCVFTPLAKEEPGALDVASFYGIPYAQKSSGLLRFAPPQPRKSWSPGVLNATSMSPICPQWSVPAMVPPWVPHWVPGFSTEEDCLVVNVWTKTPIPTKELRPVLVFIHGGAFIQGNGYTDLGCAFYNGNPIAHKDGLVVVTLNYRVGALGFLDLPELRAESNTTGNYGLQDQRLALQWVQRNIARFGGDPKRVTIAGESAGAASVLHHVVLPASEGLFSQAIVESGYDNPVGISRAFAEQRDLAFVKALGCPLSGDAMLSCIRKASVDAVIKAQMKLSQIYTGDFSTALMYYPVAGEGELPEGETLLSALDKHRVEVPLLIGSNQNETSLFECGEKATMDATGAAAQISELAMALTGNNLTAFEVQQLLAAYPIGSGGFDSWRSAVIGASTDMVFGCPTRRASLAAASGSPVYRYMLGRTPKFFRVAKCFGVPHTSDTFYVFYNNVTGKVMDDGDRVVANAMMSSWFAFARGEAPALPDGFGSGPWPKWNNSTDQTLFFDEKPRIEVDYHSDACAIVDKIVWRNL